METGGSGEGPYFLGDPAQDRRGLGLGASGASGHGTAIEGDGPTGQDPRSGGSGGAPGLNSTFGFLNPQGFIPPRRKGLIHGGIHQPVEFAPIELA